MPRAKSSGQCRWAKRHGVASTASGGICAPTTARQLRFARAHNTRLISLRTVIGDGDAQKAVLKAAGDLDAKIAELESRLFNMTSTGRGQDMLRTPSQMVEKLSHLADVVSYADFAPTDSQLEVHRT